MFMNQKEAMKYLGIKSHHTFYKVRDKLPVYMAAGKPRFKKEDMDEFMEQSRIMFGDLEKDSKVDEEEEGTDVVESDEEPF